MPPNPNVQPEFSHQLSAEQAAAVTAATAAGRAEDTRSMALRNFLQTYEEPDTALQALADGRATMEARWNVLEGFRTAGPLNAAQQQEYDRLERQIKGNQQLEVAVPAAYQRAHAELLTDYQRRPVESLAAEVTNLTRREQAATQALDDARVAHGVGSAQFVAAERALQRAQANRQEAEQIYNARSAPTPEQVRQEAERQRNEARQQAAEREAQRQAEENRVNAQRIQLEGMPVRDLRNEITRLGTEVTDLTTTRTVRVAAGAGAEELAEIDLRIARAQERTTEANRILGNKLTGATEDINEVGARTNEESFVERATNEQLLDQIQNRQLAADGIRADIETLRAEYDNPATTAARRLDLQNQIYDATQRLQSEEAILKLYQDAISKSNKDFRAMRPEQRAEELTRLANEIDVNAYNVADINMRLNNGENVTKEQMAAWTKATIQNLVENGRAGVNMAELNRILATRPELRMALATGFANSREVRNLIAAELPTGWQRMLRFAGRYQGWMMILLAILAGATAGVAALAGPVIAAGVPLAAGGAAVNYGRRA